MANLNWEKKKICDNKKKKIRDPDSFANGIRDGPLSDDDAINYIRMWNVWTKSGARATT